MLDYYLTSAVRRFGSNKIWQQSVVGRGWSGNCCEGWEEGETGGLAGLFITSVELWSAGYLESLGLHSHNVRTQLRHQSPVTDYSLVSLLITSL